MAGHRTPHDPQVVANVTGTMYLICVADKSTFPLAPWQVSYPPRVPALADLRQWLSDHPEPDS